MFESHQTEGAPEALLKEAVQAHKTRQQIWEIETELEKDHDNEEIEKRNLATRIVEGLLQQKQSAAKIAAVMSVIGLAGCFYKGSGENRYKTEQLRLLDELAGESKKTYEIITDEQRQKLAKEIGFDIVEIAHKADFDVSLQIPGKGDGYILHIAQRHYVKGIENEHGTALGIIDVQMDIEKVLLALSEKNHNKVFVEGVTDFSEILATRREEIRAFAAEIPVDETCFDALAEKCRTETNFLEDNQDPDLDIIALEIKNVFRKRALESRQQLELANGYTDKSRASFERAMREFEPSGVLSSFGEKAIYLLGADRKLASEGTVDSLPAENLLGNVSTHMFDEDIENAKSAYYEADFSKLQPHEIEKLAQTYKEFVKADNIITFGMREDFAIKKIRDYATSTKEKELLLPLIYGLAHNFEDNLREDNANESEIDFGLIRLSPRKVR